MLKKESYSFCSEVYVVEKSLEVVVEIGEETKCVKINALHELCSDHYKTNAYIKEDITVQKTHPKKNGKYERKPESVEVWISYKLPWICENSADEALTKALIFLEDVVLKRSEDVVNLA